MIKEPRVIAGRYTEAFAIGREKNETIFMPYLPAGFPSLSETVPLLRALVSGGAGAIEVGMPFTDPLADGPTIQRANLIALQDGVNLKHIFSAVSELRDSGLDIPITLMGYLNPFLSYRSGNSSDVIGIESLAHDASSAGVDGFIIVDLPPEESDIYRTILESYNLALIYLLAPTSTDERIREVTRRAKGFIYPVSVTGVTGVRSTIPDNMAMFVERVRSATNLPLAVGFGISDRKQVESVGKLCEAAVAGSAVIECLEEVSSSERVDALQKFTEVMTGRRQEN